MQHGSEPAAGDSQILLVQCPDAKGLVHQITGVLFRHGLNIIRNEEFVDAEHAQFFMRTEFVGTVEAKSIVDELRAHSPSHSQIELKPRRKKGIVVMATKEPHCVGDILLRHAYGELNAELRAVVSNHSTLESLVQRFDVPFHYVPHDGKSREAHEDEIFAILQSYRPEYVVLAKFMRCLTRRVVDPLANRIINIHHSFLPAFVGANPYKQAYQRGVKIIGATAHFVTEQLDDGPIIAQNVTTVDHTHDAAAMARAGREIEKFVLARALRLVFDDRVFVWRNKTVVFES